MAHVRDPVGQVVRPPKTAELIAGHIRGQIVRGGLAAGDTLPSETDLMVQFGVSRPTLREAFRILETESLVAIRRGSRGGARVTVPDGSVAARYVGLILQVQGATLADVYEARMVLEPACAGLLAARHDDADVRRLRDVVAALRGALGGTFDLSTASTLTYRFHEALVQASGNRTLAVQCGILRELTAQQLATIVSRRPGFFDRAHDRFVVLARSFDELIELVAAGDAEGATAHWRAHLLAVSTALLSGSGKGAEVDLYP